jgi:hypothetical protein
MSYTTAIRTFLANTGVAVPNEILAYLSAIDGIGEAALDVSLSADNTGCMGEDELTVVDAVKLRELSDRINSVRDTEHYPLALALTERDEDGMAVDTSTALVTIEQASSVFDIASDLVLTHRKQQPLDDALLALDEALTGADVLEAQPSVEDRGPLQVLHITLNTDEGIQDATMSSCTDAFGDQVFVNFERIAGCDVVGISGVMPNFAKYGEPVYASVDGANALAKQLGLTGKVNKIFLQESGSDEEVITLHVVVPVNTFYLGDIAEVAEYAGLHWKKHFCSLASVEQADIVNRFVDAMNGVDC